MTETLPTDTSLCVGCNQRQGTCHDARCHRVHSEFAVLMSDCDLQSRGAAPKVGA